MTAVAALCLALSVHDGDTIRCGSERIRLEGIDAPELAGSERCSPRRVKALASSANPSWCDTRKGLASRDELEAFLERGSVRIDRRGTDRWLCSISPVGRGFMVPNYEG